MQIDRSNYEIWIIDWMDGNLSDHQVEQLKHFLSENPDITQEFDELAEFNLKPSEKSFPKKGLLKKSIADLSGSQFEYLCVAHLENDISAGQQSELMEIINKNPEKKRIFELIQKTKLAPANVSYKHKRHLIKYTITQKVIRLSVIGLSAAAAVTLIIMTFLTIPNKLPDNINITAQNIEVDSIRQQPSVDSIPEKIIPDINPSVTFQVRDNLLAERQISNSDFSQSAETLLIPEDSSPEDSSLRDPDNQDIELKKIFFYPTINLITDLNSNTLVASNSFFAEPAYYDEMSNFSRFIAKNFREKILKDNSSPNIPLKGYEIAEAGVTGLNKLLGWEMALVKNNDDDGELRSVYFSSRILKFNAPVKKSESLQ